MDFNLLRRRTAEVDEQHRAAMATIDHDLREAHLSAEPSRVASRRGFLARVSGTAIVLGAAAVPMSGIFSAASAQDDDGEADDADEGPDFSDDDLAIVAFAETVERAAAAFYLESIESVRLPSEVEETARAFARHHTEHADALMGIAGADDPQDPAPALVEALVPQLVGIEIEALLELYSDLEEGAAATYYVALGSIESQDVAGAASTILPVEAQHAVVWGQQRDLEIEAYVPPFQTAGAAITPEEAGAEEGTGDEETEDEDES